MIRVDPRGILRLWCERRATRYVDASTRIVTELHERRRNLCGAVVQRHECHLNVLAASSKLQVYLLRHRYFRVAAVAPRVDGRSHRARTVAGRTLGDSEGRLPARSQMLQSPAFQSGNRVPQLVEGFLQLFPNSRLPALKWTGVVAAADTLLVEVEEMAIQRATAEAAEASQGRVAIGVAVGAAAGTVAGTVADTVAGAAAGAAAREVGLTPTLSAVAPDLALPLPPAGRRPRR